MISQFCFFLGTMMSIGGFSIALILHGHYQESKTFLIVGIIGFCFLMLSISDIILQPKTELEYSHYYNIYVLKETLVEYKEKRFYTEEQGRYYHIAEYKDGLKQYWVSVNSSYIVEDNTISPRIEVYKKIETSTFWRWFLEGSSKESEYKIIIPSDSITNNFNIDLN